MGKSSSKWSSLSNPGSFKARGTVDRQGLPKEVGAIELHPGTKITLKYMEEPIDDWLGKVLKKIYGKNKHGLIYKHDFVVFGFTHDGKSTWIKAEKGGDTEKGTRDAGIIITEEKKEPESGDSARYELKDFELGTGRENWTVGQVLDILEDQEANYNVLTANCWLFAVKSTEGILSWLISNTLDVSEKIYLEQELQKLKDVERIMPNALWKTLKHPTAPDSVTLASKFQEKVAHSRAKLTKGHSFVKFTCFLATKIVDLRVRSLKADFRTRNCTL